MKKRIIIKPLADQKVGDVFEWYEFRKEGLGFEFLNEWESTLEYISNHPLSCRKIYKDFRQKLIGKFPYLIFFEIKDEAIIVYQVMGALENPKKRYTRS